MSTFPIPYDPAQVWSSSVPITLRGIRAISAVVPSPVDLKKDRMLIRYSLDQYYNNGSGRMSISWNFGILETGAPDSYTVVVTNKTTSVQAVNLTMTAQVALDSKYRIVVNPYKVYNEYEVVVTSGALVAKAKIPKYPAIPKVPETKLTYTPSVDVRSVTSGVKYSLANCTSDLKKFIKGIRIQRGSPFSDVTFPAYTSAGYFSFTIPTDISLYETALYNGKYYTRAQDPVIFQSIMDNRAQVAFKIEIIDADTVHREATQEIIDSYPEDRIVDIYRDPDPNTENSEGVLYRQTEYDGSQKHYIYAPKTIFLPHQKVTGRVSYEMPHIPLVHIDPDLNDIISLPIPLEYGNATLSSTFRIYTSIRDSNNNVLEFTSTPVSSGVITLADLVPSGSARMDSVGFHTDTDVVLGAWYRYKILADLWNNTTLTLFNEILPYEYTIVESQDHLTDKDLYESVDPQDLQELDFVTGVSASRLKMMFSDDPEDIRLYKLYKDSMKSCKGAGGASGSGNYGEGVECLRQ